ncbi:MAG TPA: hypothetical protein VFY70_10405 [Thermomicrobiales bacterium]|jgi:hypothetical protein|nr:hypothetical protein [Thermomicrobiales bacterium]
MLSEAALSSNVDHVVGTFPRAELSTALAATHRAGFGPQTRVFDGARDDAARQLERAGLRVLEGAPPPPDALLIVVNAPGRIAIVAELFERLGAEAIHLAARRGDEKPAPAPLAALQPDIRIGDGGLASES